MDVFGLRANPFAVLGVTPRDGPDAIARAVEARLADPTSDEGRVRQAQRTLMAPKPRLLAEAAWLIGVAPSRAQAILSTLDRDDPGALSEGTTLVVRIRMRFQRRGGRKRIIAPDGSEIARTTKPQPDGTFIKALARAWRWQKLLDVGVYSSVTEISETEGINKSYASRILRLALLAPDIIETVLEGRSDQALMLEQLERPLPASWEGATWLARPPDASVGTTTAIAFEISPPGKVRRAPSRCLIGAAGRTICRVVGGSPASPRAIRRPNASFPYLVGCTKPVRRISIPRNKSGQRLERPRYFGPRQSGLPG